MNFRYAVAAIDCMESLKICALPIIGLSAMDECISRTNILPDEIAKCIFNGKVDAQLTIASCNTVAQHLTIKTGTGITLTVSIKAASSTDSTANCVAKGVAN